MKHLVAVFSLLLASGLSNHLAAQSSAQQKFASGGTIRLHLESGGYTINPTDSDQIVVTCSARPESKLRDVKVKIDAGASTADVYVKDTPNGNFNATIEVPRRSNLWARLTAGELVVEDIEGDKNIEARAGRLSITIHPEQYGHRDAALLTGSIEAGVFGVNKGGLFRSFEQNGSGKYRFHAHLMSGEIYLHDTH
jgi:hypothetical protein